MVVIFHVGLAQATSMSASHQPAHIADHGHGFLAVGAEDDHDHYHDEGEPGGSLGAEHHHNPLDHSHDKLTLPPLKMVPGTFTPRIWILDPPLPQYAGPHASLERPPKSFSAT